MKKGVILCFVTCCLLSAVPETQGSRLKDSLYCVMEFSKKIITCSWSESRVSRQFVTMSLMEKDGRPMCEQMEPAKITQTHLLWTCHKTFSSDFYYSEIHLIFLPDKSLESRLNVSGEVDEAKPKNLQCEALNDGMISCSWEVRQEVADSVDFTLYYHNDSGKEGACEPTCWQENIMYLSCTCNFTAGNRDNPIQFHNISVRPTEPEASFKKFKICKIIKLLPRILTVEEKIKGEDFVIKWENESNELVDFKYQYQLCYWRENDVKTDEVVSDCPGVNKTLPPINDRTELLKLGVQLQPSSNYSVKVRVRLDDVKQHYCYKGPWSEWSHVETFHTKSVPNLLLLCSLLLLAVVVLVICAACGCKALLRYKKRLDDRIPNPRKSSIFKNLRKTKDRLVIRYLTLQNGPSFPYEEHLYVEPCNKVSMWAPSTKDTDFLKQDEEQISRPHSELFQDDGTQCLFLFSMEKEMYPTASVTEGYKPFSDLIDEQNRDVEDSQFTVCAFDGPYLFS